jgi:hypothetical protein
MLDLSLHLEPSASEWIPVTPHLGRRDRRGLSLFLLFPSISAVSEITELS